MALSLSLPVPAAPSGYPQLCAAEAELVAQLQRGSEAAFRQLVARYQGRIYRVALSLLRSPAEAEDVAQEVFVDVYRAIGDFRGEAALSTWLYRLATARALRQRRWLMARRRFAQVSSLLGFDQQAPPEVPDYSHPQALLEGRQQVQLVRAHIDRLPTKQRLAFVLRHEQELSYEEVAAVLATSVAAVESLLFRARQTLRQALYPTSRHV